MPDTFSFKESVDVLETNPKTFKDWLIKAGIDPNEQINLVDPRKKYITKAQLRHLAQLHGRTLPTWIDEDTEQAAPMTVEGIAEQVAALQQQIIHRFDQVDRVLLQMLPQLQEMMSKLQEIQTKEPSLSIEPQTVQRLDQLEQTLQQTMRSLQMNGHSTVAQITKQQDVPELVSAPVDVPQKLDPPATPLPKSIHQKALAKSKPSPSKKKKQTRSKKLPTGLIVLRDFAGQHGIVTERASAAGRSGKIHIVQGKWLVNSRWATEALDAQGQHNFYDVFHEQPRFTPCEHCPHETNNGK